MASSIHIKQIRNPTDDNASGAAMLFDGTATKWSSSSTGAILIPAGTTEQRPQSPRNGMIRINTDTGQFEGYEGNAWKSIIKNVIERYSFRVNFDGNQFVTSVTNLPAGWTVVPGSITNTSFVLTQNVGRQPFDFTLLGLPSVGSTRLQTRPKSGVLEMEIDSVETTKLFFNGFGTGVAGTVASGYTTVWVYF